MEWGSKIWFYRMCVLLIPIRDNTHMTSMKIVQFSPPPHPTRLARLRPKFFHALDFGRPISDNAPIQMIANQLKESIIQG